MIYAGIDTGGTRIKMGLLQGEHMISYKSVEVFSQSCLADNLPLMAETLNELLQESGLDGQLAGVGLALPCIVDFDHCRIKSDYAKFADAKSMDFNKWSEENWKVPLILENDARAALMGEVAFGAGKECKYALMMTLGTGIGSAVLMDGRLIRGKHYLAGNLGGHMCIQYKGTHCNCGAIGCTEAEASTWALPEILRSSDQFEKSSLRSEEILDYKVLFQHADQGDWLAKNITANTLEVWGTTLQNLVYAFDPEKVILSGGIVSYDDRVLNYFKEKIKTASWLPDDAVDIVLAANPAWAGVSGAAYLIQQNI